LRWNCMC